jgi:hypothetical protein
MNAGMLWFDNDPKTALTAKIERAVDYYKHKYGRDPNLCLIHPKRWRKEVETAGNGPPLPPVLPPPGDRDEDKN